MGKGDYNGGSTVFGRGSNWFSYRTPKQKKRAGGPAISLVGLNSGYHNELRSQMKDGRLPSLLIKREEAANSDILGTTRAKATTSPASAKKRGRKKHE